MAAGGKESSVVPDEGCTNLKKQDSILQSEQENESLDHDNELESNEDDNFSDSEARLPESEVITDDFFILDDSYM